MLRLRREANSDLPLASCCMSIIMLHGLSKLTLPSRLMLMFIPLAGMVCCLGFVSDSTNTLKVDSGSWRNILTGRASTFLLGKCKTPSEVILEKIV